MLSSTTESIAVAEQSQVAEARRRVAAVARNIGYDETEQGKAALVATELATNLVKHTTGGELLINVAIDGTRSSMTLLTVDTGPGMASVDECMQDGFSTVGSSGSGLGALSRLSSDLEIFSRRGTGPGAMPGTVIVSELEAEGSGGRPPRRGHDLFGLAVPYPGEPICGDAWSAMSDSSRAAVIVVDGLGHGASASIAANAAIEEFNRSWTQHPAEILESIHAVLRSTRGAVASVAMIDFDERSLTYAGVGNIGAAVVLGADTKRLLSHNGTLGHQARRFQQLVYPFPRGAALVMHSDGLSTHWDLAHYPGVAGRSAALTCGLLYRDARRQRDDATAVILREGE